MGKSRIDGEITTAIRKGIGRCVDDGHNTATPIKFQGAAMGRLPRVAAGCYHVTRAFRNNGVLCQFL